MAGKPKNISNRTYEAIGRFIFEFSQLEYEIRYRVSEEVWISEEYFNAIMVHDFSVLCTAADHVFEICFEKEPEKAKKFKALIKKARALADIRNAVAHGLWVPFMDGGKVIHVPRTLKPNISTEQATALNKKADEACELRAQISSMTTNMTAEMQRKPWR
jgi:DNA primase